MSLMDQVVKDQPFPMHAEYNALKTKIDFWRLTYNCNCDYIDGLNAKGRPILVQHPCEKGDSDGYERRKQLTKPRNHCGNIINKYNSYLFADEATRPETKQEYLDLLKDADAKGTPISVFMQGVVLDAQVDGLCFLMPDSTVQVSPDQILTQAQARELNARKFIRKVKRDSVINWAISDGFIVQAMVVFYDTNGERFIRYMDSSVYIDIRIKWDEEKRVYLTDSIGPKFNHNYKRMPLVPVKPPLSHDSQIAPIAESQELIVNQSSWLNEELVNQTFSRWALLGEEIGKPEYEQGAGKQIQKKAIQTGSNRLVNIEGKGLNLVRLGADVAQAESVRTSIRDEESNLYRVAGLTSPDPLKTNAPESGFAKALGFQDAEVILKALARAAGYGENEVMTLLFPEGVLPVIYPSEFKLSDVMDGLLELQATLAVAQLPDHIKGKEIMEFISENFDMSDDEWIKVKEQLQLIYPNWLDTSKAS